MATGANSLFFIFNGVDYILKGNSEGSLNDELVQGGDNT